MNVKVTRDGRRVLEGYARTCSAGRALVLVASSGEGFSLTADHPRDDDAEVSFESGRLLLRGDLVGMLDNSAVGLSTEEADVQRLVVRRPQPYPFGSVEEIIEIDPQLAAERAGTGET